MRDIENENPIVLVEGYECGEGEISPRWSR